MTAITIRKLSPEVTRLLRMRAAAKGRSMEAEARDILLEALAPEERVDLTWVEMLMAAGREYDPVHGVILTLPDDEPAEPLDLTDQLSGPETGAERAGIRTQPVTTTTTGR